MGNAPVVIVTGGTRGIGLGIAECLAKEGAKLVLCGRRSAEDVQPVVEKLEAMGAEVAYVIADVSSADDRKKLIDETIERFGRLNVLINNAGVAPNVRADVLDASEESFDRLMNINLKGPYFLTQAAANCMVEQKQKDPSFEGRIVNVGSISAEVASVNRGDYCLTKAGIGMATKLWAVRLAEFDIDVFEIRPGVIATDMTGGVKEKYDAMFENGLTLQKRWGTPEDVGKVAAAMVRGDMPYATGQVVTVDGGLMMHRL
ncbi:3-ketoacyl-ACP reductase [Planctomycetota bacterium]|nr:3-ketoacyl-ACP reductase [Planctomycetota bacterium]